MARILLTGFGPFQSVVNNPSERLARHFAHIDVPSHALTTLTLPVSFQRAPALIDAAIRAADNAGQPFEYIVMLGVAAERDYWSVEQFGRNLVNIEAPDVDGYTPPSAVIDPEMPEVLPATWACDPIVAIIEHTGLPARISDSAGTYLCNYLLFTTLCRLQKTGHPARAGFLHIPADDWTFGEMRETPFTVERHIEAVNAALWTLD